MEKANVKLFTSPTCPHCKPAREMMEHFAREEKDYTYKEYSMAKKEGHLEAEKLGVVRVPTFIISGPGYDELIGLTGQQKEEAINKYIDIALGKAQVKENKSFIAKILDNFKTKQE